MRNKIIERTIDRVIDDSATPPDFMSAFKQYIKNKFDNNESKDDLKRVLALIKEEPQK